MILALRASYSESVISPDSSIDLALRRRLAASDSPAAAPAPPAQRGAGANLNAARAGAQLLEIPHPALFPPGLIVRLADPVQRLCLVLAQPLEDQRARGT